MYVNNMSCIYITYAAMYMHLYIYIYPEAPT